MAYSFLTEEEFGLGINGLSIVDSDGIVQYSFPKQTGARNQSLIVNATGNLVFETIDSAFIGNIGLQYDDLSVTSNPASGSGSLSYSNLTGGFTFTPPDLSPYATSDSLSTVSSSAFSGNYGDLSGTPSLSTVATSGSYNDLTGKPSLATVATSGSYGDLSGTPSLSTVATSGSYSDLTGKPSLATVATSGNYSDLTGKPSLSTVATSGNYSDLSGTPSLSTVATSGSYVDLSNKPSIPQGLSDLSGVSALNPADGDFLQFDILTDQWVANSELPDASISANKFASNIDPISLATSLPNPVGYTGPNIVFNLTDDKLYRYTGTAWTSLIDSNDIDAAAISETKIQDDAISSPKIQANAITATEIASNAITAEKISANAVTSDKISANAITAGKIAAGAVVADKINVTDLSAISANLGSITVDSANIANLAVDRIKIADGAVSDTTIASAADFYMTPPDDKNIFTTLGRDETSKVIELDMDVISGIPVEIEFSFVANARSGTYPYPAYLPVDGVLEIRAKVYYSPDDGSSYGALGDEFNFKGTKPNSQVREEAFCSGRRIWTPFYTGTANLRVLIAAQALNSSGTLLGDDGNGSGSELQITEALLIGRLIAK